MSHTFKPLILAMLVAITVLPGCTARKPVNSARVVDEQVPQADITGPVKEGVATYTAADVVYRQAGRAKFNIRFDEPVIVGVASKPEKWGFFQFAKIGFTSDGLIQAKWNMTRDAIEAYGENTFGTAISADRGKTWKNVAEPVGTPLVVAPNGDMLDVTTPKPIKVEDLKLPAPVGMGADNYRKSPQIFYRLSELPESRQGVYMSRLKKGEKEWKEEKAKLTDPDAARYSLSGLVPVLWWGDIRIARDKSMIAGVYPGFLIGKDGKADPHSGVFFYRSTDNGHSWNIQGRVPYAIDSLADKFASKRMGYTEPAFEILDNGTYLCVIRTSDGAGNGPMFASYSKDEGKTWTAPKAITVSGVLPQLLQLKNGVTVLASGRPGVQIRFATDQNGMKWTDAFEMLPHHLDPAKEQSGYTATVSDGYTGLLPISDDTFLIIYTDFNYKTADGNIRKAVKVRQVTVKKP